MSAHYLAHVQALESSYRKQLSRRGYDAAVIAAGTPRDYYQDDQAPAFRANPDFAHWLPADHCANAYLLVSDDQPTEAFFLTPRDYWHAPAQLPELAEQAFDVHTFDTGEALTAALAGRVAQTQAAVLLGEHPEPNLGCSAHNDSALLSALHFARARKSAYELEQLRAATRKAVAGHEAARQAFEDRRSEFDIQLAYLQASSQLSTELPYGNIVALNEHAAVLHYQYYDRAPPDEHRSFLIDAGARAGGYAADITRTYGAPGSEFADLVAAFDEAQQRLVAQVSPAVSFLALHEAAHQAVAHVLKAFDLVDCSADAAFESGITRTFLPHGLGHLLGIQTHDIGGQQTAEDGTQTPPPDAYPALRLTRVLEEDQVFTVEPGLYFIPMLLEELRRTEASREVNWAKVEALLPYGGIRIEDNVCVTQSGCENLTRDAFAAL